MSETISVEIIENETIEITLENNGALNSADREKLEDIYDKIVEGEIVVRADWAAVSGSSFIENKPTIPDQLSDLSDDSTHRTVTDTEKSTWNAKSDLALGNLAANAYYGDKGKTAYDHSQTAHAPSDAVSLSTVKNDSQIATAISQSHASGSDNQDLSGYQTTANLVTAFQLTPDNTHYPSEKLVKDSLDGKQAAGSYEPANSNIQTHIGTTSGNPHGTSAANVGAPALVNPSVDGNFVAFNGIAGLQKDSGSKAADFATSGHNHSGSYEPANSNIQNHISNTSNPHSTTASQVGAPALVGISVVGNFVSFSSIAGAQADSGSKAADFAVAAKGVTNGDSHDHNGGDGGQIAHSSLGSIGANDHHNQNHALIDTTGHTVSGLTTGHFLKASGATTYGFAAHGLTNVDVGADYYHGIQTFGALSFDNSTHILTIASGTNTYWFQGTKYTTSNAITCDIDSYITLTTNTLYYLYFDDATGTLKCSDSAWDLKTKVPVATIFWNGTAGAIVNEKHNYTRDLDWHTNAHITIGARISSSDFAITAPSIASPNTVNIAGGTLWDEDIPNVHGQQTNCRCWYQTGANSFTWRYSNSVYPNANVEFVNSASSYTLTDLASNEYINIWVYASPDIDRPIYAFLETKATSGYNTTALARAVTPPNLSNFGLTPELKLLYRIIYKGDNSFVEYTDYRNSASLPAGGSTSPTASSVTFIPAGNISSGNVQSAIEELDTEKYPSAKIDDGTVAGQLQYWNGTKWTYISIPFVLNSKLHLQYSSTGQSPNSNASFIIEANSNTGIQFLGGVAHKQYILFGDTDSNAAAYILYDHAVDSLAVRAQGGERLTVSTGIAIGASYYSSAPPTNGLIVQGTTGIKTSTPRTDLDIIGTTRNTYTDNSVYTDRFTDSNGYYNIQPSGRKVIVNGNDGVVSLDLRGVTGKLRLVPYLDSTYGAYLSSYNLAEDTALPMSFAASKYIFLTGNVGIGSTSPTYKLTVTREATGDTGFIDFINGGVAMGSASGSTLSLWSNAGQRVLIDTSGNVGIGTTTPRQIIDAVGKIRATYTDNSVYVDTEATSSGYVKWTTSGGGYGIDVTPSATSSGWSVSNLTTSKTFNADTVDVAGLADVVGTMMNELIAKGLIKA